MSVPADPHVVGIDFSLTATGIGSSRGWAVTIGEKGRRGDLFDQRGARIDRLAGAVDEHVGRSHHVDLAVMEQPAPGVPGGSTWDRAGAWWAIARDLRRRRIPIAFVANTARSKYATGRAGADKDTVLRMMREQLPGWTIDNDNEADALALAAMGRDWLGRPLYPVTDRARWEALEAVEWPVDDPADLFDEALPLGVGGRPLSPP